MTNALKQFYGRYKKIIVAVGLILLLFIIGEIIVGSFFSINQVLLTIKVAAFIALFGMCQMIVIASGGGGLDLSVGFNATIVAVLAAKICDGQNANLPLAILVALAVGSAIGVVNGLFTAYMHLPPLIVTMAVSNIVQGIINVYTAGRSITGRPAPILTEIAAKSTNGFPNILFVLIILTVLIMLFIYKTRWGMKLLGVGANDTTAYLCGINVKKVRFAAFVACGALAGIVGLLLVGNMGQAFKDMGSIYVMPSIAAVVVGGLSLNGGEANYIGVILGAIILQTLTNVFVAMGWGDAGKWTGFGIILVFMLIAYVRSKRSR